MRIEKLCDFDMYYRGDDAWIRPFGKSEAAGFGAGDGPVTGDRLSGRWCGRTTRGCGRTECGVRT